MQNHQYFKISHVEGVRLEFTTTRITHYMMEEWWLINCPALIVCITDDNPSSITLPNISIFCKQNQSKLLTIAGIYQFLSFSERIRIVVCNVIKWAAWHPHCLTSLDRRLASVQVLMIWRALLSGEALMIDFMRALYHWWFAEWIPAVRFTLYWAAFLANFNNQNSLKS